MDKLADYNIQFVKLKNGVHHYDYTLGKSFFEAFESTLITDADIDAEVVLYKNQPNMFDLDFSIKGKVKRVCDRCLDEFMLPIQNQFNLLIKITEKERENEHDITYLPFSAYQINVAKYLYDIAHLAIPMQVKCEDSGTKTCNTLVEEKLEELNGEQPSDQVDPRWDGLKKLIDTNNKTK